MGSYETRGEQPMFQSPPPHTRLHRASSPPSVEDGLLQLRSGAKIVVSRQRKVLCSIGVGPHAELAVPPRETLGHPKLGSSH
jgi:hypothetical protein